MLSRINGSSTASMLAAQRNTGGGQACGNSVKTVAGYKAQTYTTLMSENVKGWGDSAAPQAEARKNKLLGDYAFDNINSWNIRSTTITENNINDITEKLLANGWSQNDIDDKIHVGEEITSLKNGASHTYAIINQDTRVSLGTGGEILVEQGPEIYSKGAIKGGDSNSLIFRFSDLDVTGGKGDMAVLNFSQGQGGTITGGDGKLTMLGDYFGTTIHGSKGENTFAGTFTNSTIHGGNSENYFSGAFFNTLSEGGANVDNFSGIFVNGSTVNGNDGSDTFYGKYTNSTLSGGNGFNRFGVAPGANSLDISDAADKYFSQFSKVEIDAGQSSSMEGIFYGSEIKLQGGGKHEINGVFDTTTVKNHDTDAKITAFYSEYSNFYGDTGKTNLSLFTGEFNLVALGSGENTISMGKSITGGHVHNFMGLVMNLEYVNWTNKPKAHGVLNQNRVDASEGKTNLTINTGDEVIEKKFDAGQESIKDQALGNILASSNSTDPLKNRLNGAKGEEEDGEKENRDTSQIIRDSVAKFVSDIPEAAVHVTFVDGATPLYFKQSEEQKALRTRVIPNFHSDGDQKVYNGFKSRV